MISFLASTALAWSAALPSGDRLHGGRTCYAIVSGPPGEAEHVVGATLQTLTRERIAGGEVWRVVVHQRVAGGRFDMRDELVLDAHSLTPLSLDSRRDSKPHVRLTFTAGRVSGERWDAAGASSSINASLPHPVWEGDLYGPTFASLPLAAGASFRVPYYQYDKGVGAFTVTVTGSRVLATPQGDVEVWVLDAGPDAASRLEYLIAKADGRELGYASPRGGQRLGGDCKGLD